MSQHNSSKSTDAKRNLKQAHNRKTNGNQNSGRLNNNFINNSSIVTKENVCDICAQNVPGPERQEIFAFGKCDHRVCYVCSARLRVICDQSDCPICREKLENVIFSSNRISYAKFNLKSCIFNEKYKIYFETKAISDAFDKLLVYECLKCKDSIKPSKRKTNIKSSKEESSSSVPAQGRASPNKERPQAKNGFKQDVESNCNGENHCQGNDDAQNSTKKSTDSSSSQENIEEDGQGLLKSSDVSSSVYKDVLGLKTHLNYVHKLKLCDLCLTHNKLFPFEYSYYDAAALRKHMKDGEPKTSHRGHPNCALCHQTFFNTDELIQHMSREHYHCHLCGRLDSPMRIYFLDYSNLREHFKNKHFLCERGDCRHEQFTSAFDTEQDYRYHLVMVHDVTSGQSRGEARHQRTITLDPTPHRPRAVSPSYSLRRDLPPNAALVFTGTVATANSARQERTESTLTQIRQQQRLPASSEFPALGNSPVQSSRQTSQPVPITYTSQYPSLAQTSSNRQTPSASLSTLSRRVIAGPSSSRPSFVRTVGGGLRAAEELNEMDFPPLPEQPKPKVKKKSKTNQSQSSSIRTDPSAMTLDQLISASLTLSNRNTKFNGRKSGSSAGSSKASKNVKQKAIKIQLN